MDQRMYPAALVPYLADKSLFWDMDDTFGDAGNTLIGIASDGVQVTVGAYGDWGPILSYLASNPTPDTW